ncbi:MAG: M23 family metallopeptidase [Ruminococcus sp.]|nr:M23 family metallopeptidase [Ruminococcus sp.]
MKNNKYKFFNTQFIQTSSYNKASVYQRNQAVSRKIKNTVSVFMGFLVIAISIMTQVGGTDEKRESYIKYVEFNVTEKALREAVELDIKSEQEDVHIDCVTLLAYLGAKYGGDFKKYKYSNMTDFYNRVKNGESVEEITSKMQYYKYYSQAYGAAIGGMVGKYEEETAEKKTEQKYGVRWYLPIAKTFPYSCYNDFGAVRTYGYTRPHLGHDLMAAVGTPVVAVESGVVECMGWNMYGGWRIGIRSLASKRYWYYAHLRQNRPYAENLKEGDLVTAGDVIGYVGRTGYSTTENTNGITESHLHIGLELVFDESQKESDNEIWISLDAITNVLSCHQSSVLRNNKTKEFTREYQFKELD